MSSVRLLPLSAPGTVFALAVAVVLLSGCGTSVKKPLEVPDYEPPTVPEYAVDPQSLPEGVPAPFSGYLLTEEQWQRIKTGLAWRVDEMNRACTAHLAVVELYAQDALSLCADQLVTCRKEHPRHFGMGLAAGMGGCAAAGWVLSETTP